MRNDPSLAQLERYRVNRSGLTEAVRQSLYDFQLYPAAGSTNLTFFSNPVGQGITSSLGATVGTVKTIHDTNMELSGQLPAGKGFYAESIEVLFEPGASASANTFTQATPNRFIAVAALAEMSQLADINALRISGVLRFYIGAKDYLVEAPLGMFPPKVKLELDAAVSSNSATTALNAAISGKFGGRPYYLDPPISLLPNQNFSVVLNWPGLVATPSTFNGRIGIRLDGYSFRPVQ